MKISADTPEVEKYQVFDCNGAIIPYVISFDTETCDLEIAIQVGYEDGDNNETKKPMFLMEIDEDGGHREVVLGFKVPGAYATYENQVLTQAN